MAKQEQQGDIYWSEGRKPAEVNMMHTSIIDHAGRLPHTPLDVLLNKRKFFRADPRTPPESWYQYFVESNYGDELRRNTLEPGNPLNDLLIQNGVRKQFEEQQMERGGHLNPLVTRLQKNVWQGQYEGQNAELFDRGEYPLYSEDSTPTTIREMISGAMSSIGQGAMTALDILQRGQYASAKFFNVMATDGWVAFGKALSAAGSEALNPVERLSFSDVIAKANPALAEAAPALIPVLGFIGDVVLDPTTYLTFGAGPGFKVSVNLAKAGLKGRKTAQLTKAGLEHVQKYVRQGMDKEAVDTLIAKMWRTNESVWAGRTVPKNPKTGEILPFAPLFEKEGRFIGAKLPGIGYVGKRLPPIKIPGSDYADHVVQRLKSTKLGEAVQEGFVKAEKRVGEAYGYAKSEIFGRYALERATLQKGIYDIFGKFDTKELEAIGGFAHDVADGTVAWANQAGYEGMIHFEKLPKKVQDDIIAENIKKHGLSRDQLGAYTRMRAMLTEIGATEKEMQILGDEIVNYVPRLYNLAKDDVSVFSLRPKWENFIFGHNKKRVFETTKEAMEKGYVPELNAAVMLERRLMASIKARRHRELKEFVEKMKKENTLMVKEGKAPTFSKHELDIIEKDVHQIGYTDLGKMDNTFLSMVGSAYDGLHQLFRKNATIYRIGFGVRTGVDNLVRMYTLQGAKAAGGFSPESQKMAHALLTAVKMGDPEMVAGLKHRDGLGRLWSGPEMYEQMVKYNVVQDMATGGIKRERRMEHMLKQMDDTYAYIEKGGPLFTGSQGNHERAWRMGLKNLVKDSWKFWNWSAEIENVSRATVFVNSITHGADPYLAAQDVNKVLFDYAHGLTPFEENWMKRIIPFYTYNRFIFPALASAMVRHPGRVANTRKAVEGFLSGVNRLYGGEELSEAERHVLPGWLLEQPSTFLGMGEDMRAHFAAFNNFTPLDTLGFLEMDKTGKGVDAKRTVQKTLFSVLSPAIKMPFEVLLNKNLFTDRVIESTGTEQGLEKIAEIGGWSGTVIEGVDKVTSRALDVLPPVVRKMIGFELAIDPRDGKKKAYVNPYLMYFAQAVAPVTRDFVRAIDDKLTARERAASVILGVSQYKLDLQQQLTFKQKMYEEMIKDKQKQIERAKKRGTWRTEAHLLQDLQNLVLYSSNEWSRMNADEIRGLGFDVQKRVDFNRGVFTPSNVKNQAEYPQSQQSPFLPQVGEGF